MRKARIQLARPTQLRTAHHACQRYSWPFRTGKRQIHHEPDFLPLQRNVQAHTLYRNGSKSGRSEALLYLRSGRRFPDHHRWTTPATSAYQLPYQRREAHRKGEIHLHCSLTEYPDRITFSVSDTGPGIPADKMDSVFERFKKLDEFKQGSGLGLNICRTIAERLHGEVKVDKSYTNGARFLLILPLK